MFVAENWAKKKNVRKKIACGLEDGSVDKVLTVQAEEPEFGSKNLLFKGRYGSVPVIPDLWYR